MHTMIQKRVLLQRRFLLVLLCRTVLNLWSNQFLLLPKRNLPSSQRRHLLLRPSLLPTAVREMLGVVSDRCLGLPPGKSCGKLFTRKNPRKPPWKLQKNLRIPFLKRPLLPNYPQRHVNLVTFPCPPPLRNPRSSLFLHLPTISTSRNALLR